MKGKKAFTLLELLTVVIIIGILASLSYASLIDIIFTNRAKETAQTMRTFAERSLAEARRMNATVTLRLAGGSMVAEFERDEGEALSSSSQLLSSGFSDGNLGDLSFLNGIGANFNASVESALRFGTSGIAEPGFFVACGARGYCGAAAKRENDNSFKAWIKRGSNAQWGEL